MRKAIGSIRPEVVCATVAAALCLSATIAMLRAVGFVP